MSKPRAAPVLGPYKGRIDELLAESEKQPRKQRYTAHKIYQLLQQEGYRGSESSLRHYVSQQRQGRGDRRSTSRCRLSRGWMGRWTGGSHGDVGGDGGDGAALCVAAVLFAQDICDGVSDAAAGSLLGGACGGLCPSGACRSDSSTTT
ncbi:MAG: hypothetical protein R3A44_17865 [Caldilineaceae bacterium]